MLIMKKIVFVLVLFFFGFITYSQLPSISKDNEDRFLIKSKKQNKKAAVYIGIGSLALASGISMYTSYSNLDDAVSGLGLAILGGCVATGVLLFRSSAMYKKKAISVFVRKQAISIQLNPNNYLSTQTTIVLRLNPAK